MFRSDTHWFWFSVTHICATVPCNTCCTVVSVASWILSVSHKQTFPCASAKHSEGSWDWSHFLDMFKMQMDVFKKIHKNKLPACLWEGGVIDNTKKTKYEEVQKQTLCILQMHSWGVSVGTTNICRITSCKLVYPYEVSFDLGIYMFSIILFSVVIFYFMQELTVVLFCLWLKGLSLCFSWDSAQNLLAMKKKKCHRLIAIKTGEKKRLHLRKGGFIWWLHRECLSAGNHFSWESPVLSCWGEALLVGRNTTGHHI